MTWQNSTETGSRKETIKCVVVGDTAVGKTRMICAKTHGTRVNLQQMLMTHVPTIFSVDQYRTHADVLRRSMMTIDSVKVTLRLWDTFGDHEKDRRFAYGKSDVVLLCFSVAQPLSYHHAKTKWYPEIQQFCPNTPIILVGMQNDLRDIEHKGSNHLFTNCRRFAIDGKSITREAGRKLASEIGAIYYETSAYTNYGIDFMLDNAIRIALIVRREKRFWAHNLKNVVLPYPQMPFLPEQPPTPEITTLPSTFKAEIRSLLDTEYATDVTLEAGNRIFYAHQAILAASSSVFKQIFISSSENGHVKVNLPDFLRMTPASFRSFLSIIYCGEITVSSREDLDGVKEATALIDVDPLKALIADKMENESEMQNTIMEKYEKYLQTNLKQVCLVEKLFTDVIFVVDDGECHAHRSILMARCGVMAAMFSGDFKESSTERIPFPGASKSSFDICLHYLYADLIDGKVTLKNGATIIELANRLCLPHMISLTEKRIIDELKRCILRDIDVNEYIFHFLDICPVHNADQLFEWCEYYIKINYRYIELKAPMYLRSLDLDYQTHLESRRYPTLQYWTEKEYYEMSVRKRILLIRKAAEVPFWKSASQSIANCFSSFERKKISQHNIHAHQMLMENLIPILSG